MDKPSLLQKAESDFFLKICCIFFILPAPYTIILRKAGDPLSANLVFLLLLNAIFCASIRKHYNTAAFLLASFPSFTLLFYGPRLGKFIGSQMFCFGFVTVCFTLFANKPRLLILSSSIPIACQAFLFKTDYSFFFQRVALTQFYTEFIYNCVCVTVFLTIIPSLYFYIKFNKKKERLLKNNSKLALTEFKLTQREFDIIDCVIEGQTNKEIGESLFIEVTTIKTHLKNIFRKLNITNRTQLVSLISQQT